MDKLTMMSKDNVQANIEKIKALFPNAVTEVIRDGKLTLAVDFDVLKQEMSSILIDDKEERYQFTWPDKKKSILLANSPISATLRPCKEESVDFDNTENLYIEGDNLDVLKLLQETYLGKIKMIYIDPPYNTGNDFVYNDDFAESSEEYLANSGQYDEQGNRLVVNTESNGRFHTDWLNMIYPRLKIAKDLLSDDGVIFISIDDNEIENLRKICSEIFGTSNFITEIVWQKKTQPSFLSKKVAAIKEYILMYQKSDCDLCTMGGFTDADKLVEMINISNERSIRILPKENVLIETGSYTGELIKGIYGNGELTVELLDNVYVINGIPSSDVKLNGRFKWTQETMNQSFAKGDTLHIKSIKSMRPTLERKEKVVGIKPILDLFSKKLNDEIPTNTDATNEIKDMFGGYAVMDYSKPKNLIKYLIRSVAYNDKDAIILDFFSGSATTAHAVMQLNVEDNGNRKFIMVQIPEPTNESSTGYRQGYKTICEIGKERIRRAGKKVKEEIPTANIDTGFRVLKLDSSNMKDVFYRPSELTLDLLAGLESNIKEDRTSFDLLFQVMLELGKPLSSKIEEKVVAGKNVYVVDENDLIACFDENITEEVVKTIAQMKPLYAVFRDNSFASDTVATNFDQIFATYSPNTTRKVL